MAVYRVADRWDVRLGDEHENVEKDFTGYERQTSFLSFLTKYRKQIARNQWCTWYLANQLKDCGFGPQHSVVHYFAGAGLQATTTQHVLTPRHQTLEDIDPECCRLLRRAFPTASTTVVNRPFAGDIPADIAVIDCNDFTAVKLTRDEELRKNLFRALTNCQVAILADIASTHLECNREIYSKALDADELIWTIEDYVQAMSNYLMYNCGCWVYGAAGHRATTQMIIWNSPPSGFPEPWFVKVPPEGDSFFYRVV